MEHKEIHIEQDFWNDFTSEAYEHLDSIESNAIKLEQNPEDMENIHTLFRNFHTIKGLSGFVEHTVIQEVAHKTETLMDYCRKGELKVSTDIVNAILKSSDFIRKMCDEIECCNNDDFLNQIDAHIEVLSSLTPKEPEEAPVETVQNTSPEAENNIPEETPQVETEPQNEVIDENKQEIPPQPIQEEVESPVSEEISTQDKEQAQENVQEQISESNDEAETTPQEVFPLSPSEIIKPEEEKEEEKADDNQKAEPLENQEPAQDKAEENITLEVEKAPETIAQKLEIKPVAPIEEAVAVQKPIKKEESSSAQPARILSNDEYMKVANYKIDNLVDTIGELIISQSLLEQYINSTYAHDNHLISNMSGFLRVTRELQNLSMSLRLVSLKSTFHKVSRIARDTIQELKKDVDFVITGENTEIDRVVTDKLLDPLVHLIKNAISHGVEEKPEDRVAQGKPRRAKVELNAYSKRGKIFIEVKDDGRGIDTKVVYQKALEKGIIDPSRSYTDEEIKEFIMLPGFSTAKVIDNISGRGVGMDVVKTVVLKIGGKVVTRSELHKGSTFTLEIPVNHAIMNGTIIDIQGQQFIIPTVNVKEILQPTKEQWISTQGNVTMLRVREDIVSIIPTSMFIKDSKTRGEEPLVMLLELGKDLRALPITNVVNRQEVVVKPVGEEFSNLKYISGMSILGTGKVSLILDVDYLFKKEVKE